MAKPGKKKKLLFVLEIVVLLLFIGGLYVYGQISSRLDKIEQPKLDEEKIMVNQEAPKMTGYKTYVLFGPMSCLVLIPEGKAPSILHRTVIP